jgi:hypothetical protein
MDTLAKSNRLWTVFEPLNPLAQPEAAPYAYRHFGSQIALDGLKAIIDEHVERRPRDAWTGYRFYSSDLHYSVKKALSSPYEYNYMMTARYVKVAKRELALRRARRNRVIVKFIRANLLLEWLTSTYTCPTLLMIRHPAAVIRSRMKLNNRYWNYFGEQQQEIVKVYMEILKKQQIYHFSLPPNEELRIKNNEVLGCSFLWCFENAYAYEIAKKTGLRTVFYEDYFNSPDTVLKRIVEYANLQHIPTEDHCKRPSQQSSKKQKKDGIQKDQLQLWQRDFSSLELKEIQSMLDLFKIDFYKADEPLPLVQSND